MEILLLVFLTGDTSTRRKAWDKRKKKKKKQKKCEVEKTDAPRQRYEEKAEITFLTPNTVVCCVCCICCTETIHSILQEARRKGVKVDGIKENTKSKKE